MRRNTKKRRRELAIKGPRKSRCVGGVVKQDRTGVEKADECKERECAPVWCSFVIVVCLSLCKAGQVRRVCCE
jgi:hypothetical protein